MKTLGTGLVVLCMLLAATPAVAGMTALGDRDLSAIHAGSGVSLDITGTNLINIGSMFFRDYDTGNGIELNNIVWSNGSGGGFSFATPAGDPFTIDVGTNTAGQTIVDLHDSTQVSPRAFGANLHFLEYSPGAYSYDPGYYDLVRDIHDYITDYIVHDLGSLNVSGIVSPGNNLLIGAHGGIDFQYNANIAIGSALYNYNTANALAFTGIQFFGTTPEITELPQDPTTWKPGSGSFQTGNMAGGNPAQIDVGTDTTTGVTEIKLALPMTGEIRVENVNFGGADFGPLALSGLDVHRLAIQINPHP
jgi:hypothetical protein